MIVVLRASVRRDVSAVRSGSGRVEVCSTESHPGLVAQTRPIAKFLAPKTRRAGFRDLPRYINRVASRICSMLPPC